MAQQYPEKALITIGVINIICTDLERSLEFYRDVLGFEVLEKECHPPVLWPNAVSAAADRVIHPLVPTL